VRGPWSPLASSILWSRGKLALREDAWRLPDGTERAYPVLAVGVAVGVLGFVEPDRVLLVRQFRHLTRAPSWELPGGGGLTGEAPEAAAQRELREEGAYLDEVAWCYVAHGLTPDPLPADDDEFLERSVVPVAQAIRMALDGEITESVSKVTLLQYALTHERR
jgi:ADP-ribose pyrophosphatase